MEYRRLGTCGLSVSALTLGNWATHGAQIDDRRAIDTVHAALDQGITSFDTSDSYASGRAEELLGMALKGQPRQGAEILTTPLSLMAPRPDAESVDEIRHVAVDIGGMRRQGVAI